jgi:hypothetical protein
VRLTSNDRDFDPDHLLKTVRLNKLHHKHYNPTLLNREWSKHFKEVVEKLNKSAESQEDKIDYEKEFFGKQRYFIPRRSGGSKCGEHPETGGGVTLYDPSEIKSTADILNYKRGLCTLRVFKQFKANIDLQKNVPPMPKLSPERLVQNQLYVLNQYRKNMVRPSATKGNLKPKYLAPFNYERTPDVKEKLYAVKKGIYDLEKEDVQLNDIIKDLQTNPKNARRKLSAVGLLNFQLK